MNIIEKLSSAATDKEYIAREVIGNPLLISQLLNGLNLEIEQYHETYKIPL